MLKVTGSRSKVAPGSDHDVAQLHHGRNLCPKFELLPAYGHRDLARTNWQPPPARPYARRPARPARMKTIPAKTVKVKNRIVLLFNGMEVIMSFKSFRLIAEVNLLLPW